jgi:hypothetical protein
VKFLCTYRILTIDADDADDAFRQARGAAAESDIGSWEITESTSEEVELEP